MDNIFEKISLTLILLKIFDIYFFHYFATNKKIVITHLWHAIEPQTMYHLIAKDKVAEQHISFFVLHVTGEESVFFFSCVLFWTFQVDMFCLMQ